MNEMILQLASAVAGGLFVGVLVGWMIRTSKASRELAIAQGNWQQKLENAVNKARASEGQAASLQASLADTQQLVLKSKHAAVSAGTEIESLKERHERLAKTLSGARAERDVFALRVDQQQQYVVTAKQRIAELNEEFSKSREFYKSQLGGAIEQRHALERKVESLESEHTSLTERLAAAKDEQESLNSMLANARRRLENLDAVEHKTIALEADNSDMRHKLELSNREIEKLKRNADEIDDLRQQNRELARCLDSMEKSRRQYEKDARRYREQFESSEKESNTLRMRLGDIEKGLTEMQAAEAEAREVTRKPPSLVKAPAPGEGDDLTQIVGVGKVFESMLHDLGIYYFRQIATFGPSDLARVNAELKEFKGRIENDDWIGQARELHYKKYGNGERLADTG